MNFALPREDEQTTALLGNPSQGTFETRFWVGGPIWTCPAWVGKLYPPKTAQRNFLEAYGRQLNSVETNATFYRVPTPDQVREWKSKVPADFRFAPKLHQDLSHGTNDEGLLQSRVAQFWEAVRHFGETLGICFLQLPPHVGFESRTMLKRIIAAWPAPARLAIEFRHPSWFSHQSLRPELQAYLRDRGISTVITDVAGRRDVLHSSLSTRKVIIRWIGNERHPSDAVRLDQWADRLASWAQRGMEEVYFFVHQPTELEVPECIQMLIAGLRIRLPSIAIRSWKPLPQPPPDGVSQMTLF